MQLCGCMSRGRADNRATVGPESPRLDRLCNGGKILKAGENIYFRKIGCSANIKRKPTNIKRVRKGRARGPHASILQFRKKAQCGKSQVLKSP